MNNKILVVGTDHHNTLGLIESLGQKGIRPYVMLLVSTKADWVLKSRYVEKGWVCVQQAELINNMLQHFTDKKNKTIVLAASDTIAVILDRNFDVLKDCFVLPTVRDAGSLDVWMSKEKMAELAHSVGIITPKTIIVDDNQIPSDVDYPCITSAISSVEGSKSNISICKNEIELQSFLGSQGHCDKIRISKFIDKAFEFQFLGCSLGNGDEVLITGRTHIDRPNGIDNTFFLRFDKVEDEFKEIENKVVDFIKQTGYSGPFSVEFLRGKDGVNYFTEMNFRNDGNAVCQTAAGFNIPYIYYLYYSGGNYKKEIAESKIKTTWLMPELFYLKFLLQKEFGFKEWCKNMHKANCYTTYFKDDKRPFIAFVFCLIKGFFRKHNNLSI